MKKILFTEKQLRDILGEDFNYIDKSDNGCNFAKDSLVSTGSEVTTKDPDADTNPTLDKIASQRMKSHPYYRKSTFGTMYESNKKKELTERNHNLDGKKFILPKDVNKEIQNNAEANKNDIMLNNMSKENGATANSLYVRKNRLEKMKKENPQRFQEINGKRLEKTIGDTLNRAKEMTKTVNNPIGTNNVENNKIATDIKKGHRGNTIYYEND